jgi:hypothetical protein
MDAKWLTGALGYVGAIIGAAKATMTTRSYGTARLLGVGASAALALALYGLLNPTDITHGFGPLPERWETYREAAAGLSWLLGSVAGWRVVSRVQRKRLFDQTWPSAPSSNYAIPDKDPPKNFPWPWW